MREELIFEAEPFAFEFDTEDGGSGRGYAREFESAVTPVVAGGVIHPRIDVFAQYALQRMFKGDIGAQRDAAEMLAAVKSERLWGIYKEDEQEPALRARRMNKGWWEIIPPGEDAVLFLEPTAPFGKPPIIDFRDSVRSNPARLDPALRRAWASYVQWRQPEAGPCEQMPPNARRVLTNVTPGLVCQPVQRRLRVSVWTSARLVTPAQLSGARGLLDDVSLLRTITNDTNMNLVPDPLCELPPGSNGHTVKTYADMIAACHAQGVQILAGYALVPECNPAPRCDPKIAKPNECLCYPPQSNNCLREPKATECLCYPAGCRCGANISQDRCDLLVLEGRRADRFSDWLLEPDDKRSPTMEEYARRIVRFLTTLGGPTQLEPCQRFDGISFDIEKLKLEAKDYFTEFCFILAYLLAQENMIVAVAVGGKVDDDHSIRYRNGTLVLAPVISRALDYRMALGNPNLIIRPMAYDAGLSGQNLARWHADILDYALNDVGLSPAQFQLGVKTDQGAGFMTDDEVADRCIALLRPTRSGLIVFSQRPGEKWNPRYDGFNNALNTGAPAPPTGGEPLQAPLVSSALACPPSASPAFLRAPQARQFNPRAR